MVNLNIREEFAMKKTIAAVLTVMLLVGGMVIFRGERPQPEIASIEITQQA